jgi:uncharacterized protein (TIGR03086 family)
MTDDVLGPLAGTYATTGDVLAAIPTPALDAPSPCEGWTVRVVANHVVAGLDFFARTLEGRVVEQPDPDAPDPDHLGADPAGAYRRMADRCLAAFRGDGALDQEYPFPFGPTTGEVIANISLQESLVHGWDIARGAGLAYSPDPLGVDAVARFNAFADGSEIRRQGMFGPARPAPPDADPFATLLARLGRRP